MAIIALGNVPLREPHPTVAAVVKPTVQAPDVKTPQPGEAKAPSKPEPPDQETLDKEIAFANSVTKLLDTKVSFSYDPRIKQIVVKVVDSETEEVIRQFPPEEMIKLRLRLKENFQGIILNKEG